MWKIWLALPKGHLPPCVYLCVHVCETFEPSIKPAESLLMLTDGADSGKHCVKADYLPFSQEVKSRHTESCDRIFTVVPPAPWNSMTLNTVPHSSREVSPENTQRWVSKQICSCRAFAAWVLLSRLNTQQDKQTEPSFSNTAHTRPRPEQDWSVNLQEQHRAAFW